MHSKIRILRNEKRDGVYIGRSNNGLIHSVFIKIRILRNGESDGYIGGSNNGFLLYRIRRVTQFVF